MTAATRAGRPWPRGWALAVLACALLLRLIVPQGWMPIATGGGWQIAPCSGSGPMAMPGPHHRSGTPHHAGDDGACPYAGLAAALEEALPPTLPRRAILPPAVPPAAIPAVTIGRGLAAPPPPATGPPHA